MFPSKPKTILKQQSISSMIQYDGQAGVSATPKYTLKTYDCPILIKQKVEENRRIRRGWNRLPTQENKRLRNKATQELKELLNNNKNY
jgi:hypothetical protein